MHCTGFKLRSTEILPQIHLVQVEPAETGFIASCHHSTAVYLEN